MKYELTYKKKKILVDIEPISHPCIVTAVICNVSCEGIKIIHNKIFRCILSDEDVDNIIYSIVSDIKDAIDKTSCETYLYHEKTLCDNIFYSIAKELEGC